MSGVPSISGHLAYHIHHDSPFGITFGSPPIHFLHQTKSIRKRNHSQGDFAECGVGHSARAQYKIPHNLMTCLPPMPCFLYCNWVFFYFSSIHASFCHPFYKAICLHPRPVYSQNKTKSQEVQVSFHPQRTLQLPCYLSLPLQTSEPQVAYEMLLENMLSDLHKRNLHIIF